VEWPQRTGATVAKTPCGIMPFALVLKRDLCEEYKLRVLVFFTKKFENICVLSEKRHFL